MQGKLRCTAFCQQGVLLMLRSCSPVGPTSVDMWMCRQARLAKDLLPKGSCRDRWSAVDLRVEGRQVLGILTGRDRCREGRQLVVSRT